jgi:phasin family protein
MAKTQTAFDYDVFKMPDFSQLQADYSRMVSEFGKMFANGKLPMVDVEAVTTAQRKNIEAVQAANQVAFEGYQAVARRQAEIVREASEELQSLLKELATASAEERISKQADAMKALYEHAVANTNELATMVQRANTEAATLINKRVSENLDEVKSVFANSKAVMKDRETVAKK